jgi:glutamine---fructose-6-phosphate transaminase (isomerizing)
MFADYSKTIMEREALSAPTKIAAQLKQNKKVWADISKELHRSNPAYAMTIARGSSDHAATFAKYLFEVELGLVTSSAAPSVQTVYKKSLASKSGMVMGISQSGASPDLYETQQGATDNGACTIALVNQENSLLAKSSKYVVPLHAGVENAVAATKSYLATLVALVQFVAIHKNDRLLLSALERLPETLEKCANLNWDSCLESLLSAESAYVIGRGFGYPVAQEAALKLKETSSIHAEPFSSAEVLHGPFALIKEMFPVLIFAQNDASLGGVIDMTSRMTAMGAKTIFASPKSKVSPTSLLCSSRLEMPDSIHPILDPILIIQSFYYMAAKLAVKRGLNPDKPKNLKKVTETR